MIHILRSESTTKLTNLVLILRHYLRLRLFFKGDAECSKKVDKISDTAELQTPRRLMPLFESSKKNGSLVVLILGNVLFCRY